MAIPERGNGSPTAAGSPAPAAAALGRSLAAELKYKMLIDSINSGVLEIDRQRQIVFTNAHFCRMTGFTDGELQGKVVDELVDRSPDTRSREAGSGPGTESEVRLRRKDGTYSWIHVQSAPLLDRWGRMGGAVQIWNDITERKRTQENEDRLRRRVEAVAREWQLTFDAVGSAILILNADGEVLRLNRVAMQLSGRPYIANLGKAVGALGGGEPWRSAAELVREVSASGSPAERHVEDPEAGKTWDLAASPVSRRDLLQPGPPTVILIVRDISEIVALQRSLRRNEMMSVLGSLVAGVAHEVRNPLFAMSATLDAFEACAGTDHELVPYIQILRSELERMGDLMRDLLIYGKPVDRARSLTALGGLIERALESCRGLAERQGVGISAVTAPDLPEVPMDDVGMQQVFKNLLENGIQHTPPGGRVEVAIRLAGGGIECTVRDTGKGIEAEDLPRIFEPFFSRRRGGTGLGLSLAQRIVEEHGGRIRAQNHPRGGAVLRLELPVR